MWFLNLSARSIDTSPGFDETFIKASGTRKMDEAPFVKYILHCAKYHRYTLPRDPSVLGYKAGRKNMLGSQIGIYCGVIPRL